MSETDISLIIKLNQICFADPKRIHLLKEIEKCGSINQAAKNASVSYKSAWDHLESMDCISPKPLLNRNTGGKNGGGTTLTVYAKRLLQLYGLLEKTQKKAFDILQDENIPLDSLLSATARFSLQSSARNQFFGKITALRTQGIYCYVDVMIENSTILLTASITEQSADRLQLHVGKEVMTMIKAPWIKLHKQKPDNLKNTFEAQIISFDENKCQNDIILLLEGGVQCCAIDEAFAFHRKDRVYCSIDPDQIMLITLY